MDVPGIRAFGDVGAAARATTGDKLGRNEFLKLMGMPFRVA